MSKKVLVLQVGSDYYLIEDESAQSQIVDLIKFFQNLQPLYWLYPSTNYGGAEYVRANEKDLKIHVLEADKIITKEERDRFDEEIKAQEGKS
jgi:hypothetical protein